jgi:hypothetical protein
MLRKGRGMDRINCWLLFAAIAGSALGCEENSPCGEGTVMEDGKCVSVCGSGTVFQDGKCVAIAVAEERKSRDEERESRNVVEEFSKIKDEMCQCKTKDCAERVNKKFEDWLKKNEKSKGSRGQQERAKTLAEDYTRCMMTAMAGKAAGGE